MTTEQQLKHFPIGCRVEHIYRNARGTIIAHDKGDPHWPLLLKLDGCLIASEAGGFYTAPRYLQRLTTILGNEF
jgi:hypothetical protein